MLSLQVIHQNPSHQSHFDQLQMHQISQHLTCLLENQLTNVIIISEGSIESKETNL